MKISTFLKLWSIYAVVYFLYHYQSLIGMGIQDNVEWTILSSIFFGLYAWELTDIAWNRIFLATIVMTTFKLIGVTLLLQFKIIVGLGGIMLGLIILCQSIYSWGASLARAEREEDCYPMQ